MKRFTLLLFLIISGLFLKAQIINETFDASKTLPTGWGIIKEPETANSSIQIKTFSSFSPKNNVNFRINTKDKELNLALNTPEIAFKDKSTYKVSFRLKSYKIGNIVELGFMTDLADKSTYQKLKTFENTEKGVYNLFEAYIKPNQKGYLVFKAFKSSFYFDNVCVEEVKPYDLKIEKNSNLESLPNNTSYTYQYVVKNTGLNNINVKLEATSNLTTQITDEKGNTISSLAVESLSKKIILLKATTAATIPNNSKEEPIVFKATIAENSEISESITSKINTYTTYKELNQNFDSSDKTPANWHVLSKSEKSTVVINTTKCTSQPNCLQYSNSGNAFLALVSPKIDFTKQNKYKVSFRFNGSKGNKIELGTLSDPADESTFKSIETFEVPKPYEFGLIEAYVSVKKITYLAFKHVSGTIYIDDVKIEPVLPYNVWVNPTITADAVASGDVFNYKFIVRNAGEKDANINLEVQSDLATIIKNKKGETIKSISLKGLDEDVVSVQITAPAIEQKTKIENLTFKATVAESTEKISLAKVSFTNYKPFAEVEENFEKGVKPFAWTVTGFTDRVKFYGNSPSSAHTGNGGLLLATSKDKETFFISPKIEGFKGDYRLSFWLKGKYPVEIGKITNLNDWTTYTKVFEEVKGENYSYKLIDKVFENFTDDAYIVIKCVGKDNYTKAEIDEIDIEKYRDVELDLTTDFTEKSTYFGKCVSYPVYINNKGKKEGTFNINVNSSWSYKIFDSELKNEISKIVVAKDKQEKVFIQINVPAKGVLNGASQLANVKISAANDATNFEEINLKTWVHAPYTYINEGFENLTKLPLGWMAYTSKLNSNESKVNVAGGTVFEGEKCVYINHKSGLKTPTYLLTPVIKESEKAYSFSFYANAFNKTLNVEVGYFTDPNDIKTYHKIKEVESGAGYKQFVIENIVLTESAALAVSIKDAASLYLDNFVVKQSETYIDFSVKQGQELAVVNPELFINFSKPIFAAKKVELTNDNINQYISLRKESLTGDLVELNYQISANKQMVKITPVKNLKDFTYYLIVNDKLIDIDDISVKAKNISFSVKDKFAPEFVKGYPIIENIKETTFDLKLQANENSTIYYILVAKDAKAPNVNQVKAGADYDEVKIVKAGNEKLTAKTNLLKTIDGLKTFTDYDLYVVLEDNAKNIQAEVTKLSVKTIDLTAPEFIDNYPLIENVKMESFDAKLKSNEAGNVFYILVADKSVAPSVKQIKAGENYGSVKVINAGNVKISSDKEIKLTFEKLNGKTKYDIYFAIEDNSKNIQKNVAKRNIETTNGVGVDNITKPELVIVPNPVVEHFMIKSSEEIISYTIYNSIGNLVCNKTNVNCKNPNVSVSELSRGVYFVRVKTKTTDVIQKIIIK